jgi:hypothetical protein
LVEEAADMVECRGCEGEMGGWEKAGEGKLKMGKGVERVDVEGVDRGVDQPRRTKITRSRQKPEYITRRNIIGRTHVEPQTDIK